MPTALAPDIEFNWIPALWAAGVVLAAGLIGNFALGRPQLLGHGAVVAGVVASFRSGYYQNSGYSAAVGTFLGTVAISPVLAYSRATFVFGIQGFGDTLFVSGALLLAWLIVVVIILLPLAYFGAFVGDYARKKLGGVLGY